MKRTATQKLKRTPEEEGEGSERVLQLDCIIRAAMRLMLPEVLDEEFDNTVPLDYVIHVFSDPTVSEEQVVRCTTAKDSRVAFDIPFPWLMLNPIQYRLLEKMDETLLSYYVENTGPVGYQVKEGKASCSSMRHHVLRCYHQEGVLKWDISATWEVSCRK